MGEHGFFSKLFLYNLLLAFFSKGSALKRLKHKIIVIGVMKYNNRKIKLCQYI